MYACLYLCNFIHSIYHSIVKLGASLALFEFCYRGSVSCITSHLSNNPSWHRFIFYLWFQFEVLSINSDFSMQKSEKSLGHFRCSFAWASRSRCIYHESLVYYTLHASRWISIINIPRIEENAKSWSKTSTARWRSNKGRLVIVVWFALVESLPIRREPLYVCT